MKKPLAALILAAGRGERMNSNLPKVLHKAAGYTLIEHVVSAVRGAGITKVAVVIGVQSERVRSFLKGVDLVLQKLRLGTGHAVMQAERLFGHWPGELLMLPGDAPCVRTETLRNFVRAHQEGLADLTVLTAEIDDPTGYGRILRQGEQVVGIREELDASDSERAITEVNSGIYMFNARLLFKRLHEVQRNEKKEEYYLTDVVEAFHRSGGKVRAFKIQDRTELLGINTRKELSVAHQALSERELARHSKAGVTIVNPLQTSIAKGVRIGRDTTIHPFTWIEPGVVIGRNCEIGPFAKVRSGSQIGDRAVIGSFVEIVRSKVGRGTFVKHLSYLGDARIGNKVNVGAGTITANFDGKKKNRTVVENGVFLGCDTILVAPVKVGARAKTGAGAVVCGGHSVPRGKTVVGVPAKLMTKGKKQ
ncbi:MAG: bifunctional N-acetylglucosamine-1-phosphate uridyltransferase/glucosamine-1-phosphate acetyltransferase [Candidatus Omnitrophica bacterium]|nr:bifunctional N-acetylglucosamine-1-phosphate uridyltransferase/glucosamine-1-phosphate acetyltransferase [Candidatus Omnitrophota bacterium]